VLGTSSFSGRQAVYDAAAAAAKENGAKKQEITRENALEHGMENMEWTGSVLSTDTEAVIRGASLFDEGARDIDDVEENKLEGDDDDDDDDDISTHPGFNVKRRKVVEEATMQLLVSETKQERKFSRKTDYIGESEEIHEEHLTVVDVQTTAADTKHGPPHQSNGENSADILDLHPHDDDIGLVSSADLPTADVQVENSDLKPVRVLSQETGDEHVTAAYVKRTTDTACGLNEDDTHSGAADVVSGSQHLPGIDVQVRDRDVKDNKPVIVNVDQAEDSDKQLNTETETEEQSKLNDESESLEVSLDINTQMEFPTNREITDSRTVESGQYWDKHRIPVDVDPNVDNDATEMKLPSLCGSNEEENAVVLHPHSGAADVVTGSDHPLGVAGQVEDRDHKDNKSVHVQSQGNYKEQTSDTEEQECLSSHEEEKGELAKGIGCSEMALFSKATDAANLDRAEDINKPPDAECEEEERSNTVEEYKDLGLGVSDEIKSQAECPYKEAVETKVGLHISNDGEMSDNETVETEQYRTENVQSAALYADTEYVAAVEKAKRRLNMTSLRPDDNSVLNSLRFYTREEHLDEYFCTTCNEG